MAGQNNVSRRSGGAPKPQDQALTKASAKRDEILNDLDLDLEVLGERGKSIAEKLLTRFADPTKKSGPRAIAQATSELRNAHQQDLAEAYQPPEAPSADITKNWASQASIKKSNGQTKLVGPAAESSHPLGRLLNKLEINPSQLGTKVAARLFEAIDAKEDLATPGVWNTLAKSLLLAHMRDTKSIAVASVARPTAPTPSSAPQSDTVDPGLARNPELAAAAPQTSGVGSANGALSARIQNMMGADSAPVHRKKALRVLTKALVKDLELSPAQERSVSSKLGRIVKNSVGSDGSVRSSNLATQAFQSLAEKESAKNEIGPYTMAFSLLDTIDQQIGQADQATSQALDNLMANFAAFGLKAYVADSLGKDLGSNTVEEFAKLQEGLSQLTSANLDAENLELTESAQPFDRAQAEADIAGRRSSTNSSASASGRTEGSDSAEINSQRGQSAASAQQTNKAEAQTRPQVSEEVRRSAQQAMQALKINPEDPQNTPIQAAYEQILGTSKGNPAEIYMEATKWLDQNLGSNRAEHDAKLLEQGVSPSMLATMINDRFATIAAFITNPAEVKKNFLMNEKMAGAGANAGLEGNGLGGKGGFRFGTANSYGTGGLLGPGSPMDADGSKNHIYAQRSLQVNAILNDPALSIEDKIFYFMMWFAAYADKEREQKMREIADLDTQNQENNLKRKGLERDRQALYGARKTMQQGVQTAESKLRSLSPKHEEITDVKNQIAKLNAGENPDQNKLSDLNKKLSGLERLNRGNSEDITKASGVLNEAKSKMMQVQVKIEGHSKQIDQMAANADSGTKSRELLFMELERIQRFRGMLIDMANSFMRDMARRVKEIMQ